MSKPQECIELLSVELLDQYRPLVTELKKLAASLKLEFGWHYLLDLTWIISRLGAVQGKRIIDAGAGTGILQWYLAEHGAEIISVDRDSRKFLPIRFRKRFLVTGLRESDLAADRTVLKKDFSNHSSPKSMLNHLRMDLQGYFERPSGSGHVAIYNQDLADLKDIPNNSIDIVASVSALEHNSPENLSKVVKELIRILKPGGSILATLTASHSTDSWHAPSAGWCYTAETIRQLFGLPEDIPDNYRFYDQIMTGIRNHAELRDNLARFYFESGQNGMPWGIWDPQYLPVGVWKVKKYA